MKLSPIPSAMTDYIAEFLASNNRLIVPDLGAFIAKQGAANDFAFNEFLRYNDGLLAEYIAKKESIEKDEAVQKINDFVQKINISLADGGKVSIGQLGFLQKDKTGKIIFERSQTAPLVEKPTVINIPDAPEKPVTVAAKEPKKEEKPAAKPAQATPEKSASAAVQPPAAVKPAEDEKPLAGQKAAPVNAVTDHTVSAQKESAAPPNKLPKVESQTTSRRPAEAPKAAHSATIPPITGTTDNNYSKYQTQKRSNMSRVLWIFVILVLLGVGAIYVINNKSKFFKPKTIDTPVVAVDSSAMDSTLTEEPIEAAPVDIQPAEPSGVQYYVVAGCFRIESNADKYVQKLQSEGYKARKFGQYKGLHTVCFDSFTEYGPALGMLRDIRNGREPYAWILKY